MKHEGAVRRGLEALYSACGALSAVFLLGVAGFVLYSMGGGLFGYIPRGAEEFAGYSMLCSAAFGFAYTFRRNGHIRVTLIVGRLSGGARRASNVLVMLGATLVTGYLAWFCIRLAWQSWVFNDLSQGLIALPLWIPQSSLSIGTTVLFIAVLDKTVRVLAGEDIEQAAIGEHGPGNA